MSVKINSATEFYFTNNGGTYHFDYILDVCLELIEQFKANVNSRQILELSKEFAKYFLKSECLAERRGTLEVWHLYCHLIKVANKFPLGTFFHHRTHSKVRRLLESARKTGQQIRIFYGDPLSGKEWLDIEGNIGEVGRSLGPLKAPLLVKSGKFEGSVILSDCIVKVLSLETGKVLYCCPNYQTPKLSIEDNIQATDFRYSLVNQSDENCEVIANLSSYGEACHLSAFLLGHCSSSPIIIEPEEL